MAVLSTSSIAQSVSKVPTLQKNIAAPLGIIAICLLSSATQSSVSIAGIHLPPMCPFKMLTGFDCPGCGITRALIFAFHGRWTESYMMHLWGIPLAAFLIYRILSELYTALTHHPIPAVLSPDLRRWRSHIIGLSLLVPWIMKTAAVLVLRAF